MDNILLFILFFSSSLLFFHVHFGRLRVMRASEWCMVLIASSSRKKNMDEGEKLANAMLKLYRYIFNHEKWPKQTKREMENAEWMKSTATTTNRLSKWMASATNVMLMDNHYMQTLPENERESKMKRCNRFIDTYISQDMSNKCK